MQGFFYFFFYHEPRINLLFCHMNEDTSNHLQHKLWLSATSLWQWRKMVHKNTIPAKEVGRIKTRGIYSLVKSSYSFTFADRHKWGKCLRFIRPQGCFLLTRHHDNTENHQTYQGMPFSLQCPLLAGCSTKGCSKLTSPFPLSWDRNGLCAFSLRMLSHFDQSKTLETATI